MRVEMKEIHAELRNLRIDHQLVQSYSHAFDRLFAVFLFTMRDKYPCSNECDKNTMVIHSLGLCYIGTYTNSTRNRCIKKKVLFGLTSRGKKKKICHY